MEHEDISYFYYFFSYFYFFNYYKIQINLMRVSVKLTLIKLHFYYPMIFKVIRSAVGFKG